MKYTYTLAFGLCLLLLLLTVANGDSRRVPTLASTDDT